jgi:glycosyltransferase involved in cell wall biosynthesis
MPGAGLRLHGALQTRICQIEFNSAHDQEGRAIAHEGSRVKFSLILATIGRVREVGEFLAALARSHYPEVELIVVDQNSDDRLGPILAAYKERFSIMQIHSAPGLSRGRNQGLRYASGEIVAFPDDDCWYPPSLLSDVDNWFRSHPDFDGLSVCSRADSGERSNAFWDRQGGVITEHNVWRRAISISVFLRSPVIKATGDFDECLGIGSGTDWGSGEETDYLIRALRGGFRLYYEPALSVIHPRSLGDERTLARAYSYGLGYGYVLRKHRYPFYFVVYCWFRSLGGMLLALARRKPMEAIQFWATLRGRIRGWAR